MGEHDFEVVCESVDHTVHHIVHVGVERPHQGLLLGAGIFTAHGYSFFCDGNFNARGREVSAQFALRSFDLEGRPVHGDGDAMGHGDGAFDFPCYCHLYTSVHVR
ncbi:hypothetical protein SDC9_181495 [bioreactor metagenome]|uniref:Uncharacterized protein n=1 Tax=bioreactor metagenome TaxID=1076179 RepID=A0A645HDZ8_9ZZZZ